MSEIKKIKVRNNVTHNVGYTLPNSGLTKNFLPGQIIPVNLEEIEEALYQPGVMVLFQQGLLAVDSLEERIACGLAIEDDDKKIMQDVVGVYTKEEIVAALKSDKLIDIVQILKDGTSATKQRIIDLALEYEIFDGKKNAEIKKYTGADVFEIHQNKRKLDANDEEKK